jgi:tRNA(Arg) A34 adenosine deaminase TadA
MLSPQDEIHLLASIDVAARARANGNHPFGSVLVVHDGRVLAAENTVTTGRDVTGHAETNLVRLAWQSLSPEDLAGSTLYASTEPCAMCAGAIYWAGIGRVVYALGEDELRTLTGAHLDNPTLAMPCRQVFAAGQKPTVVAGPFLKEQALAVHQGFWTR